jgi:hypothetical protein
MPVRLLAWLAEKLLYAVFVLGGIFCMTVMWQLPSAIKKQNEYLEMRLLKAEITETEASREKTKQFWEFMKIILPVGIGSVFAGMGAFRLGQFRRDHSVKNLIDIIRTRSATNRSRIPRFVLYLRPFSSTNKYVRRRSALSDLSTGRFAVHTNEEDTELEREVQRAFSGKGKVVALGKPGEHIGVGRISSTETTWQGDVRLLIEYANWIVCVPSSEAGILWETELLFSDETLSKTIFLMPPSEEYLWKKNHRILSLLSRVAAQSGSRSHETAPKSWEDMRTHLLVSNIVMPPHRDAGCLFYMTSKLTVAFVEELGSHFDATWSTALKKAEHLRKGGQLAQDVWVDESRVSEGSSRRQISQLPFG